MKSISETQSEWPRDYQFKGMERIYKNLSRDIADFEENQEDALSNFSSLGSAAEKMPLFTSFSNEVAYGRETRGVSERTPSKWWEEVGSFSNHGL